ncbi:hypothetical protein [Halocynthiibacter namhaensis]|uniref:hypothetical protein n=1 Tax=Halocynthiibacter namhaensis TaxID=1290553 RepID=UPI000578EF12|nr:hypothetical protein [Halocynthiibacter namhaensis]
MKRPQFEQLTPEQQLNFGNGVGPGWLPASVRDFITKTASWFFKSASWRHHDFGYAVGGDRWDRARCDWRFYAAMVKDAFCQRYVLLTLWPALILATAFYLAVRIGGQFGSFEYRDHYATLAEIMETYG